MSLTYSEVQLVYVYFFTQSSSVVLTKFCNKGRLTSFVQKTILCCGLPTDIQWVGSFIGMIRVVKGTNVTYLLMKFRTSDSGIEYYIGQQFQKP